MYYPTSENDELFIKKAMKQGLTREEAEDQLFDHLQQIEQDMMDDEREDHDY